MAIEVLSWCISAPYQWFFSVVTFQKIGEPLLSSLRWKNLNLKKLHYNNFTSTVKKMPLFLNSSLASVSSVFNIRDLKQRQRQQQGKRHPKIGLALFKFHRSYSNSSSLSYAVDFFRSLILMDYNIKLHKRKRKSLSCVPVLLKTWSQEVSRLRHATEKRILLVIWPRLMTRERRKNYWGNYLNILAL